MRILLVSSLVLVVAAAVFAVAGRGAAPVITHPPAGEDRRRRRARSTSPSRRPAAGFSRVDIVLEQRPAATPLFSLGSPGAATLDAGDAEPDPHHPARSASARCRTSRPARAKIVVTAARTMLFGLRTKETSMTRATSRCASTRRASSVVSTHHYVNLGGAEMVVYRVYAARRRVGRPGGRRVLPGLPGVGRGRRRRGPRAARSRSSRCSTTRTWTRRSACSRATRPATRRTPRSTTRCSRSRSARAASS